MSEPRADKRRAYRKRRREKGGQVSDGLRQFILYCYGYRCAKCGSRHDLTLDHITPISEGGQSVAENLQVLCDPCHVIKNQTHPPTQGNER